MGSKKGKKLEKISQMPGKERDLVPASDAVKSAVTYMKTLEKFFEDKSHGQIDVFPLLAQTLKGAQSDNQPAAISGRVFFDLNCFIQKNETQGIMQRELKEISSKEKHNGKMIYNFVSKEVVSALSQLIKDKDMRQVDPLLQSIVLNIQHNPAWITFWQERIGVTGIDADLQTRVLQSLVYKIAGDCHQEYLANKKPSLEEQKAAIHLINAFKLSALKVSPVLPAILADKSVVTPVVPTSTATAATSAATAATSAATAATSTATAATSTATAATSSDVSPRQRANAFLQTRTPALPVTSTAKEKPAPLSTVKRMADDYQRKIDDIKAQSEPFSAKGKPTKKR